MISCQCIYTAFRINSLLAIVLKSAYKPCTNHVYKHAHMHVHTHAHVYTYTHPHTPTHTHTHPYANL